MRLPASAPSLSGPSSSSTGTFKLVWAAVAGASRYQLNQNLNGTVTMPYNANGTSWSSSNLGDGTYNYAVYPCNAAGCGPGSNGIAVTVLRIPAPPAPLSVPGTVTVNVPFTVSWSAVSGATRYDLTQTDISGGGGATTIYSGSGTSTLVTLGAPVNRVLDYSARACNSAGCSGWVTGEVDLNGSGTPMAVPASAGSSGP